MTPASTEPAPDVQDSERSHNPEEQFHSSSQEHHDRQSTTSLPQVFTEDTIDIGNGRRAHFRRDRRYAQVQVAFTAPKGIDPNPGRELTDQFKELGWTWQSRLLGKPWVHQLDRSTPDDPTARGDSRDVLHEQFLLIIQEYRVKHGMTPFLDGFSEGITEPHVRNPEQSGCDGGNLLARTGRTIERQEVRSEKRRNTGGGRSGGDARRLCQRRCRAIRPYAD